MDGFVLSNNQGFELCCMSNTSLKYAGNSVKCSDIIELAYMNESRENVWKMQQWPDLVMNMLRQCGYLNCITGILYAIIALQSSDSKHTTMSMGGGLAISKHPFIWNGVSKKFAVKNYHKYRVKYILYIQYISIKYLL